MGTSFAGMNWKEFWDESDYFTSPDPVTGDRIRETEHLLGYKLPQSYLELIQSRNGGSPVNSCFPTDTPTSWAEDHVAVSGICGIGGTWGIDSEDFGSRFMIEEWGYPDIGIVVCECPSAGHDAIMLDYSECGREGEPRVIHVDVETDGEPRRTFLAEDFESFIRGLVNEEEYDDSEETLQADLEKTAGAKFSGILEELSKRTALHPDMEFAIRHICTKLVRSKGYFALHADDLSYLMYDIQFAMYTELYAVNSKQQYLGAYPDILTFGAPFSTGGYAEGFVAEWYEKRLEQGHIDAGDGQLAFTPEYRQTLSQRLTAEF
ncbi:SMI1/KNR4 family protein [Paenibacillus sp. FJAT-26967]|uniref:SMI1/KNR4 family protein n=1 Tax=Paenibacillus sp. FJAT-26967 TaxID=1729690 RepID=UPI000838A550|nr:SMI1/KNR4 family protein [Paenibacillus sp. FJAT-26967]